jgi:hypothetical protein
MGVGNDIYRSIVERKSLLDRLTEKMSQSVSERPLGNAFDVRGRSNPEPTAQRIYLRFGRPADPLAWHGALRGPSASP